MERKRRRKHLNYTKIMIFCLDAALAIVLIASLIRLFAVRGDAKAAAPKQDVAAAQTEPIDALPTDDAMAMEALGGGSPSEKFAALSEKGVKPVAWLTAEGTPLDYPVMQNADDEYYLARNALGEKDSHGAISLDGRNSDQLLDAQIILYGNAMADGSMFGSLVEYRDQAYYDAHKTMTLYTSEKTYTIHIYSAHMTSPDMANYRTWFDGAEERQSFIDANIAKSCIAAETAVPEDAKLITLVTNSDYTAGEDSRFALRGYLSEE